MKNVYKIAFLYKFFERTLHRAIYRTIYKNIYIYRLVIFITRCTNYLPPHEEDIYGLNYLKLKEKSDFIDVGASDGLFFKGIRFIGFKNKFIAFEPLKTNIKYLSTIKKKYKNFKFYTIALGARNGALMLYIPYYKKYLLSNWASYSKSEGKRTLQLRNFNMNFDKLNFKKRKIKQRKLDFFKLKPTLIKMDVEGYENKVLLGAIKTIKKYKPVIYVENNFKQGKYNTINFFKRKLSKFGYKPYIFNLEQKSFFKYNKNIIRLLKDKQDVRGKRYFSYNIYFITKKHFIIQ